MESPLLSFEENLWVIVQPASDVPGQWLARCLNLDIVSSGASLDGVLGALAQAVTICMGIEAPSARRKARREEWALLERIVRDGRGGVPPEGADIAAATQLRLSRRAGTPDGPLRARWLPWVWLERSALAEAPVVVRDQLGDERRALRQQTKCGYVRPTSSARRGANMASSPEIVITTQDFERLQRLVACIDSSAAERLDAELARARLVAATEIPADVVTMNSDVVYEDEGSGERRAVRLVYPRDAEAERGWVSVLAPVGSALLGLRQGQQIDWPTPRGTRRLRVVSVPYQPESHGHYAL
jgi:regulator of nucleoside diphosphate kinase